MNPLELLETYSQNAQAFIKATKATPTEKLVNLDQLASVIEFLVSNRSLGINGQSIIVDNGWSQTKDV
jgi:enoyl-[acyl-carrier-protein] reductase (NADH)